MGHESRWGSSLQQRANVRSSAAFGKLTSFRERLWFVWTSAGAVPRGKERRRVLLEPAFGPCISGVDHDDDQEFAPCKTLRRLFGGHARGGALLRRSRRRAGRSAGRAHAIAAGGADRRPDDDC